MQEYQMSKPNVHVLVIPFPTQVHVDPMLKLAKLLHSIASIHVTFVITELLPHSKRLFKSLPSAPGINFATLSIPISDDEPTGAFIADLIQSTRKNGLGPLVDLVEGLNGSDECPRVTCLVSDGAMSFTQQAADQLNIPNVVFYTMGACAFMGYFHFDELFERGYLPLKDESDLTNGYLETRINFIPSMEGIRLKDLQTFIRTTNSSSIMLNFNKERTQKAPKAKAIILNTYEDLEKPILEAIQAKFNFQVYTLGPIQLLENDERELDPQERMCLKWLDQREENSVIYVNFVNYNFMSSQDLCEFAWGLAKSGHFFLWVVPSNLVTEQSAVLLEEFLDTTKRRGMLVEKCPEQVLQHPSIRCFVAQFEWNRILEALSEGVPMICWPFFAEQPTNCYFACEKWGVGIEIDGDDVKRDKVERVLREMMEGERGREMKKNALMLKDRALAAVRSDGSSYVNLKRLINEVLL